MKTKFEHVYFTKSYLNPDDAIWYCHFIASDSTFGTITFNKEVKQHYFVSYDRYFYSCNVLNDISNFITILDNQ